MPLLPTTTPNVKDLKISEYKVVVVDAEQGKSQDLSQLVTSIQWDWDLDQPAEHYKISFAHVNNIGQRVKPGDRVKLYGWAVRPVGSNIEIYWENIKRIYISETTSGSEQGGEMTATGYNVFWFLMRNKDSVMLQNESATAFIKRTAGYYGIPIGEIAETGVQLQREPFINRTVWDMWVSALSYTRDLKEDARFILQENQGKIDLVARTKPSGIWKFQRGVFAPGPDSWANNEGNLFSSNNTFSMEQYINAIRVYKGGTEGSSLIDGGGGGGTGTVERVYQFPLQADIEAGKIAEINRYGLFMESVDLQMPGEAALNLGNDAANAEQQAQKIFKKRNKIANTGTVTTFNINTLKPGDPVYVRDDITGLVGMYFAKSGSHVITDQEASMTLTVNIEDALPEAYEAQRQKKDSAASGLLGPTSNTGNVPIPDGAGWTKMSGSISIRDRYALMKAAGWGSDDSAIMTTISTFECGNCDMTVASGTDDIGLLQINSVHWAANGGMAALSDPKKNVVVGYKIWRGAGGNPNGFNQWHVYPNWNGTGGGVPLATFNAKLAEVRAAVGLP
jgi:hypothetical protein